MPPSVQVNPTGPDWPLGFISVAVPGTPVGIMSLVDSGSANSPSTLNPPTAGREMPIRCHVIIVCGFKPGGAHGWQNNTGNIYVVRKGVGAGVGNRDDTGSLVGPPIAPGQTVFLEVEEGGTNDFNPYDYSIDADNAGDGSPVTLMIA